VSHTQWHHHHEWPGEPRHVHDARQFVASNLVCHGLDALVHDAVLVASELATNAIVHARTSFGVSLSRADGHVLLQVTDASSIPPRRAGSHPLDTSGRGLSIVETVSQTWGVDDPTNGLKNVWASFLVPQLGDPGLPLQT
jgi:anti-sigma regulatory factor (Ser/Thr protein kinase)